MNLFKMIGGISLAVVLVGCDSRIDAVNQQMASIRSQPPLPIEPAPSFDAVPSFDYSAQQLRSPFYQVHWQMNSKLWLEKEFIQILLDNLNN